MESLFSGLSGLLGAVLGAAATYAAAHQANRHNARMASRARLLQESDNRARERHLAMAQAWGLWAALNQQIAVVRGLHRAIEEQIRDGEAIHPGAELFQLMKPLNNVPRIEKVRASDIAILTQIAGGAQLITRLNAFDSDAMTLQMISEKYSELRSELRREVLAAGLGAGDIPADFMERQAPLFTELRDVSEYLRADASSCYTAAEGLFADVNRCLHAVFGDLGFPRMALAPFDLDKPYEVGGT